MSKEAEKDPKTIPPVEEKVIETPPTAEELAEQAKEFGDSFFSNKKPEAKKAEKKPVEPPKDEKKVEPEPEKKKEEERKPKKGARSKILERLDQIDERISKAPTPEEDETEPPRRETNPPEGETDRSKPDPKQPEIDLDLTEEEQEHLDALKVLERNPKHKGASAKVLDFWSKLDAYQKRWEARNPGEKFKAEDTEHADFYANEPSFSDGDLRTARRTLRQEQIDNATKTAVDKVRKESIDPALEEFKRDKAVRDNMPFINASAQKRAAALCALVSDEFSKIVTTDNGPALSQEAVDKMAAEDPELFEIVNEHAEPVEIMVKEIEKVTRMPNHFRFDPNVKVKLSDGQSFRPHQQIMEAWELLEQRLSNLPADKQVWEGRRFMPGGEFQRRWTEGNPAAREKLQRSFWTPSPDDLSDFIVQEESRKIKQIVLRANSIADRRIKKNGAKPETEAKGKDEKKPEDKPLAKSPATTSSSDTQDNTLSKSEDGEENTKKTHEMFFS